MTPGAYVREIRRIDARLAPFTWSWAEENRAALDRHWKRLRAEKPRIFDGRVLLLSDARIEGDVLRARFFETGYSRFLGWRDAGFPDRSVANGFAMGALRGSDGAYVMGVMAPHTANAGRVYFAAGTPDLSDLRPDGTVDLGESLLRELREETGLDPAGMQVEPGWVIVREGPKVAFLRRVTAREPAAALEDRIRRNLLAQEDPELVGARIVRGLDDLDEAAMPDFLKTYLRWSFGRTREPCVAQR